VEICDEIKETSATEEQGRAAETINMTENQTVLDPIIDEHQHMHFFTFKTVLV